MEPATRGPGFSETALKSAADDRAWPVTVREGMVGAVGSDRSALAFIAGQLVGDGCAASSVS